MEYEPILLKFIRLHFSTFDSRLSSEKNDRGCQLRTWSRRSLSGNTARFPYQRCSEPSHCFTVKRITSCTRETLSSDDSRIERNLWRSNRIDVRLEIRIRSVANTSIRNRCCCEFTQTDVVRAQVASKGRWRKIRGNEENCSWNKFSSFRSAILLLAYKLIFFGPTDPSNLLLPRDKRVSNVWKDRARCETRDVPFWYA